MDNSYLFDMKSGVVLATDNRHRNNATMEQITEYLSRFLQFRDIYKALKEPVEDGSAEPKAKGDAGDEVSEEAWWGDEDIEAPWVTQSTRLMPNCTLALWQFTP